MEKKYIYAIGLMSGTSLDGVDVVYVRFSKKENQEFSIVKAKTYPYNAEWIHLLKNAITFDGKEIKKLDRAYGIYLAKLLSKFIDDHQIKEIDLIASHGHTILHQPHKGITVQVGDGQQIANTTRCKVVCDFRTQDVKLGGQGAPLVPIGDQILFSNYEACLNLGGFANISYQENQQRIAFDICPINTVLNFYAQQFGFDYDDEGKLASKGNLNQQLLFDLQNLEFYQQKPPKSLGIEWVNQYVFPLLNTYQINVKNLLRTFVEHAALQISASLKKKKNVLITGGGAYHLFLLKRIENYFNGDMILPNKELVEYKEALIFALLGLLKTQDKINCLASVTGAKHNHSSGRIFNPKLN